MASLKALQALHERIRTLRVQTDELAHKSIDLASRLAKNRPSPITRFGLNKSGSSSAKGKNNSGTSSLSSSASTITNATHSRAASSATAAGDDGDDMTSMEMEDSFPAESGETQTGRLQQMQEAKFSSMPSTKTPADVAFVNGTWVSTSSRNMDNSIHDLLALGDFGDNESSFDDAFDAASGDGDGVDHERKRSISLNSVSLKKEDLTYFLDMEEEDEEKKSTFTKKALIKQEGSVRNEIGAGRSIDCSDLDLNDMEDDDADLSYAKHTDEKHHSRGMSISERNELAESLDDMDDGENDEKISQVKNMHKTTQKQKIGDGTRRGSFASVSSSSSTLSSPSMTRQNSLVSPTSEAPASKELNEFRITADMYAQFMLAEQAHQASFPQTSTSTSLSSPSSLSFSTIIPHPHKPCPPSDAVNLFDPAFRFAWITMQAEMYEKALSK